jgi:two-component system chemotaxis response regulator CheV
MTGILDDINKRTQLVGKNRLELLMFRLADGELYGINVFKVREVINCPKLTVIHSAHPVVRGVANIRGRTVSIMDLGRAISGPAIDDAGRSYIIITEFNRTIQGFMVHSVERIVNLCWDDVRLPPEGAHRNSYINAVTSVDNDLVQLIDVEQVLDEVVGEPETVSAANTDSLAMEADESHRVLVVDDSKVARSQIIRALAQAGIDCVQLNDGRQALNQLKAWADQEQLLNQRISMVISDIEMPEMDGYTLTSEIRRDPRLKHLYVLLHSSLSGNFNESMVKKVGADSFIAKFSAVELLREVRSALHAGGVGSTAAA